MAEKWRVGHKVPLNVYEGDRPVCQCHSEQDAARIVEAMAGVAVEREACARIVDAQATMLRAEGEDNHGRYDYEASLMAEIADRIRARGKH